MPALLSSYMRNVRSRDFFAWCLSCGFAGVALAVSAQTQSPDQNPDANAPVAVPPDTSTQPQTPVAIPPDNSTQPQPTGTFQPANDLRDSFWGIQKTSEDDDWTRHFRIGAMVGFNISANFSTKGTFSIPGNNAANGIYDDGYVRVDSTGNSFDYTGYFGYNSSSQLSGSTLTMHSIASYTASSSSEGGSSVFPGFEMAYGGSLWDWGHTRIGWDLGFGLLPISINQQSSLTVSSVNQTVYTFNTGNTVVPEAPYQGGFTRYLGEATIHPEFTTANNPISGPNNVSGSGSYTLDVMLYTVRLGPSFYWDLNEYIGLSASAGPAIGIVSGKYEYNETITVEGGSSTENKGQIDGTDVVYGGYVNASLMYHLVENGDLYLGVQYMPLGNASISGGGRQGQLNLGGQVYISAGINWPF